MRQSCVVRKLHIATSEPPPERDSVPRQKQFFKLVEIARDKTCPEELNRAMSYFPLRRLAAMLSWVGLLAFPWLAPAQPVILSSVPTNNATGVSTTTTIVFTFSVAMNPAATSPLVYDDNFVIYPTAKSWSAGNTVLTCTPGSAFPAGMRITWVVTGQSAGGQSLGGVPTGTFTTAGGGLSPLVLTNAVSAPANFSFDVLCASGQTVTVEYRTNIATGLWQTLLTTNSPGNRFRAVAPQATSNSFLIFRARNGT